MGVNGLRSEIRKGNLDAEKIAGRLYVTRAGIERMREKCKLQKSGGALKDPNSTYESQSERVVSADGSSLTGRPTASESKSAQAHLKVTLQKLRQPSLPISPESTSRNLAEVVPIRS